MGTKTLSRFRQLLLKVLVGNTGHLFITSIPKLWLQASYFTFVDSWQPLAANHLPILVDVT